MFIHLKSKTTYNKKRCIISTDNNDNYFFFAPIVSHLWTTKIMYHPVIFIFGEKDLWFTDKLRLLVMNKTLEFGGDIIFVDSKKIKKDSRFDGYNVSMLAQISRLFPCHFFHDETYCLTSDIDMLPLNYAYFNKQDFDKDINIFFSNGYKYTRFPICYIGMKVNKWREVIGINNEDDFLISLNKALEYLPRYSEDSRQWGYDEVFFFEKMKPYLKAKEVQFMERKMFSNPNFRPNLKSVPQYLPYGRLDRSCWVFDGDPEGIFEAHCKRPGFEKNNWKEIMELLVCVIGKDACRRLNDYHKEFMEVYYCEESI